MHGTARIFRRSKRREKIHMLGRVPEIYIHITRERFYSPRGHVRGMNGSEFLTFHCARRLERRSPTGMLRLTNCGWIPVETRLRYFLLFAFECIVRSVTWTRF